MAVDVYLLNFNDSRVECDPDDLYNRIFGPHPSVRTHIEHSSYGRTTLHLKPRADNKRTVFGPIMLPYSWRDISCAEFQTPKNSLRGSVFDPANFTAADWNSNDFGAEDLFPNKRILFIYPKEIANKCGMGGESYRMRAWVAKCDRTDVILHELGHQLEFDHGAQDPDDKLSEKYREYGDESTVMGSAKAGFNAPEAINAGWVPAWAVENTEIVPKSSLDTFTFTLAPLDTMPEDLFSLSTNASLAVRIRSGCSEFLISFRSRTTIFGTDSPISSALPDGLDDACLLHRDVKPTLRRPLVRSNLVKIVPSGSKEDFEKPGDFLITISCSAKKPDGTIDVSLSGAITRVPNEAERPSSLPVAAFNASSADCAVQFQIFQRETPVSSGYGVGFVGVAQLVDPKCSKASVSIQVATNFTYFHMSVYPSGASSLHERSCCSRADPILCAVLEFDTTKSNLNRRYFRVIVASQWEISGPWTLILAKLVVRAPNNAPSVLSVSIQQDLRPLVPRLPIRVDEFYVVCPTPSCIGSDSLLTRPGSFCCSVAFRGHTYRSPSLTLRMKTNPTYRALLPYTLYPGGSEWSTLADMHGFGVVASGPESNETLVFELVEGADNVVGTSSIAVPFDNCNTLPSLQFREPDWTTFGPRKPFEKSIGMTVRLNAITFETSACPSQNYTYKISVSEDSTSLVDVGVSHLPLTTQTESWDREAALILSPAVPMDDLAKLDGARATLLLEANESPHLGARSVDLLFRKPDLTVRVVSMPETFQPGPASTNILIEVKWNGSSTLETPCKPRRVILVTESNAGPSRVLFPYLSFDLRSNEPRIMPIEYVWPESSGWIESDELRFYAWLADVGSPLDSWGSAWQTPSVIEVTSPFVVKTTVPLDLRSNLVPVWATVGTLLAAVALIGGIVIYRKRYSIGFSLIGNTMIPGKKSNSFKDLEMSSPRSLGDSSGSDSDLK
jgi:hypothetical protein